MSSAIVRPFTTFKRYNRKPFFGSPFLIYGDCILCIQYHLKDLAAELGHVCLLCVGKLSQRGDGQFDTREAEVSNTTEKVVGNQGL